jgi:hypothetical protein
MPYAGVTTSVRARAFAVAENRKGDIYMLRSRFVRAMLVPALAVPALGLSLAFATPAFAAATTCTGLSGPSTGPVVVTGCNDPHNTGGGGTFAGLSSPVTINWTSGGDNTFTFTYKIVTKKVKCPAGDTEVTITGKITGHSGVGSSVKGKVKATICLDSSGNLSLLHGTKFTF